ncbi:MAG: BtpA/SgcQ family protein [Sulfitobacter sp.]|uniref:BtpA/SgcQ family protein n=1 Tax=Alphaproteobacteria TaxID=28211 RepID=UPI002941FC78|nr:BtpA/SgcQ family protein [Sulfitobacter sp. LC.270.F.C4]WOI16667.1 BtpA/SgcQ family protein [Sulfitobacter sp. LC.270.F.C4]
MIFDFLGDKKRAVVSMCHMGALPGSPLYDSDGGINKLIDDALSDIHKLQEGGVDAIMFGNENDRPYLLEATPESIAAYSAVVQACKPELKVPFGVNYLWDPTASIAIAVATQAKWVREIFTGVFASDMGVWAPNAARPARMKRNLDRRDVKLFFNINAEFAHSLDQRPIELRAKSAIFSSMADAILVSGPITGQPADASDLRKVAEAVGEMVPVFANTGVNVDNVTDVMSVASGCIIGSHFKIDGDTWNAVDGDRVKRFMDKVNTLR